MCIDQKLYMNQKISNISNFFIGRNNYKLARHFINYYIRNEKGVGQSKIKAVNIKTLLQNAT